MNPLLGDPSCTGAALGYTDVVTIGGVVCIMKNLLRFLPPFILLIAIFMLISSGAQMIIQSGNPKEVQKAQQSFTFTLIGVIGIGLSWVILVLIEQFTGAPVTEINFP